MTTSPRTRIRYFGAAAYEIVTPAGAHILIDPYLDENPGSPVKSHELERVDLILVTHAAVDHLGNTDAIALRTGAPVICGGEVKAYLMAKGVPATQIRATAWGIRMAIAGIEVLPVECHHCSHVRLPDGAFVSGTPLAFIVFVNANVRFYHYGDTALFSDLKLQGELYKPTIGCLGIANPLEILDRNPMPGEKLTSDLSPHEGVLAAQWLGLKTVLPCHYINPDNPLVHAFAREVEQARSRGETIPDSIVMAPGDWIEVDADGVVHGGEAANGIAEQV